MSYIQNAKAAAVSFMAGAYPDRDWFIIGGLIRDTDMGFVVKDIDIFISGYKTDPLPEARTDDGSRNAYLMRAQIIPWLGFQLNLVFLRGKWDLERTADRCDYGVCQAGWCPKTERTYRSDQYIQDIQFKQLTLCRDTVPERQTRMQNKFPHYTHMNPKEYLISDKVSSWAYNSETHSIEKLS
jgi:hypothetical protein